jgi:ABC-type multidrug transport system ATPase subunit
MNEQLLSARGLHKSYTRGNVSVNALKGVSLSIKPGEILGLLGPNGSGKSTLVRAVAGLVTPDSGDILWNGASACPRVIARDLGVLLEGRGAANDRLSTIENARYFCALRESEFRLDLFRALVEALEIPDPNCPVRQYSTGIKLRVSLLVTLIHRPSLVLLDEPTLGLDALGVEQLERVIRQGIDLGVSFLMCSHDLHFLERLCRRIACLHKGEIIFDGITTDFCRRDYQHQVIVDFNDHKGPLQIEHLSYMLDQHGRQVFKLKDNADLSHFLSSISAQLTSASHFEVRPFDLREKYIEMLKQHSGIRTDNE